MGNLLLGIWRDVLGRLRKSSSSSERGTLQRWALLMRSYSARDIFKIVSSRSYADKIFAVELKGFLVPRRRPRLIVFLCRLAARLFPDIIQSCQLAQKGYSARQFCAFLARTGASFGGCSSVVTSPPQFLAHSPHTRRSRARSTRAQRPH